MNIELYNGLASNSSFLDMFFKIQEWKKSIPKKISFDIDSTSSVIVIPVSGFKFPKLLLYPLFHESIAQAFNMNSEEFFEKFKKDLKCFDFGFWNTDDSYENAKFDFRKNIWNAHIGSNPVKSYGAEMFLCR